MARSAALILIATLAACAPYAGEAEEVSFTSRDGVVLRATLVVPEGASGPLPAVVLLHGAEAATRSFAYRMQANIFVDRGMVALLYDKRGAGASGGNTDSATFAALMDDALAAIAWLKQRPEVDPSSIGVIGASESGWFTPEIADRVGDLAFVINKVGPCSSWRETVAFEVYNDLLADGVGEASALEQAEIRRRLWDYDVSPSDEERLALQAVLAAWNEREDSRLPTEVRSASPAEVGDIGYDPAPFLARLTTPTLYVYGSEDPNIPSARCAEALAALAQGGVPVSHHVFVGEGHELGGVGLRGYRFVDGYAELLGDFAAANR